MSHRRDAGERLENILEDRVSRRAAPLRSLARRQGTVILCDLSREKRGASVDQRSHNRGGKRLNWVTDTFARRDPSWTTFFFIIIIINFITKRKTQMILKKVTADFYTEDLDSYGSIKFVKDYKYTMDTFDTLTVINCLESEPSGL